MSAEPTVQDPMVFLKTTTIAYRKGKACPWNLLLGVRAPLSDVPNFSALVTCALVTFLECILCLGFDRALWVLPWLNIVEHIPPQIFRMSVEFR